MKIWDHVPVILSTMCWQVAGPLHADSPVTIAGWEKWQADIRPKTVNGLLFRADPPSPEDIEKIAAENRERFLSEFEKRAGNLQFRVSSRSLARRVEVYAVTDSVAQDAVIGMVQEIADKGFFEPVMVDFFARRPAGPDSGRLDESSRQQVLRRNLVRRSHAPSPAAP